jgi:hypothetical protein
MVDERDRLRRLRRLEAETAAAAPVAPVGAGGSLGLEDRIRQLTATTSRSATPAPRPTSSVPTTPVNQNLSTIDPIQSEIDVINAATQSGKAVLDPTQYPMAEIMTNTGQKVMVYTGGPLAGQDKDGNFPIQATDPASFAPAGGGASGTGGGGTPTGGLTTGTGGAIPIAPVGLTESQLQRKSAYDILYTEFKKYGLESLVEDVKGLIMTATSDAEITMGLRASKNYQKRFAANEQRIAKGLTALDEATYLAMEDQYQEVMRQYGLPESYYAKDNTGKQVGFEQLLANDISNLELEDRIATAQKRVLNANPEVTQAIKQFYPDITNADILAYTLDPKNAIENIKRKVTAAEIGGAAIQSGLKTGMARAEELGAAGVTKESARQGFGTIAGGLQRGSQLASIYGEDPYTQTTAEQEVFNIAGAQEARKQRQKVTGLEKATFGGQSGVTSGALARDRAGGY